MIVVEENEPFIEDMVKAMGIMCEGRSRFPWTGELNPNIVAKGLGLADYPQMRDIQTTEKLINRPPTLCPGCPHRGVFYSLNKLNYNVTGDIGCYTLGLLPPLSAVHTCQDMGASVNHAHGFEKALGPEISKKTVAVIGDSTFLHSGVTGLMSSVYNGSKVTLVIMDNRITAMTGHQQNPSTGMTLMGTPAKETDIEGLCRAIGVEFIKVVDPLDIEATKSALSEATAFDGPAVVITRSPCALIMKERRPVFQVDENLCIACGNCLKVACMAVSLTGTPHPKTGKPRSHIDPTLCVGCSVCAQVCPVKAIKRAGKE